jgi:hypothetical protein
MEATGLPLANAFLQISGIGDAFVVDLDGEEITEMQGANRAALQAIRKATRGRDGN